MISYLMLFTFIRFYINITFQFYYLLVLCLGFFYTSSQVITYFFPKFEYFVTCVVSSVKLNDFECNLLLSASMSTQPVTSNSSIYPRTSSAANTGPHIFVSAVPSQVSKYRELCNRTIPRESGTQHT